MGHALRRRRDQRARGIRDGEPSREESQAGNERAADAFGPRFHFHLFIQVERVEVPMLVE